MREIVRAMVITALVAGSAKASMAGYHLLLTSLDSLVAQTYNADMFVGDDAASASMRDSVEEINGKYTELRRSSDATGGSTGTYKP